ncbi:MAG: LuxR C-terminal-related transcriptional regulator [Bacteroidales bacterium]|nr:LuxR C-terminal-related transcriptional regulator [Bacteroidales bacterium]
MLRLFVCICAIIYSEVLTFASDIPRFYRIGEGIEEINYTCICQDKFGFMWLGSKNGLIRYDGYEMKKYRSHSMQSSNISANWVTDIVEDSLGNLWVGTFDGGLNYFDRQSEKFKAYVYQSVDSQSLSSNTVLKLLKDFDGSVWVATANGLNRVLKDKKIQRYDITKGMYISTLVQDEKGNLWIGTFGYGLLIYNPQSKKVITLKNIPTDPHSLPDNNIRSMLRDTRGNIWIGTHQQGLWRVSSKPLKDFRFEKFAVGDHTILCLLEDSKGNIWIGTENGGLHIYYPRTQTLLNKNTVRYPEYFLQANSIWAMYEDKSEAIWVATFNKGLYRYDRFFEKFPQPFEIQKLNDKLSSTSVTSLCSFFDDQLLIGTDGDGIFQWNYKNFSLQNLNVSKGISSNSILSITPVGNNILYLGTWGGGVSIVLNQKSIMKPLSQIFNFEHVFSTLFDSDGNIWIGTWGNGLHILHKSGQVLTIGSGDGEDQISNPNIFNLFADSKGRIWISTLVGLNVATKNTSGRWVFKRYYHHPDDTSSLFSSTVLFVTEDMRRNIWIGTTSGLNKYNEKLDKVQQIKPSTGLLNCEIKSIIDDEYGNLWMGSDIGLIYYSPKTNKAAIYDKTDGLPVTNFSVGAVVRNQQEQLIFGGIHGILVFHPDSIRTNPVLPSVYITEIKIFGKTIDASKVERRSEYATINLNYNENAVTIDYVALNNYCHPEKNLYAYQLQGVDKDWIFAGNRRSVTYSHLQPGKYTFMVKAANNDGLWNESPTLLKITILPPFWKTIWFRLLLAIAIFLIIYFYLRQFIRKNNEKILLQKQKLQALQIEKEKEIAQLQSSKLQQELQYKIKELESTTLSLIHKNERFIELRDRLNEIMASAPTPLQRQLSQIVKSINQDLDDEKNWENFERHFNPIHDNFLKRFAEAFPDLTHNDLKLCALIRMNMSNKEIASFLNISLRSVESRRYRIRKRMGIDSDINLNDFIVRF